MEDNRIIRQIISFIKLPDVFEANASVKIRLFVLFKVYLITIFLLFTFSIIISIISEFIIQIEPPEHKLKNVTKSMSNIKATFNLLPSIIFIPIYEEIVFRNPLSGFNRSKIALSISLILSFYLQPILTLIPWYEGIEYDFYIPYLLIIVISIPLFFICNKILLNHSKNISNFWSNRFKLVFYGSCIAFALHHFNALNFFKLNLPSVLFGLIPYFIMGISLVFIRIRLGLIYSIFLHYLFAVPIFILMLLSCLV